MKYNVLYTVSSKPMESNAIFVLHSVQFWLLRGDKKAFQSYEHRIDWPCRDALFLIASFVMNHHHGRPNTLEASTRVFDAEIEDMYPELARLSSSIQFDLDEMDQFFRELEEEDRLRKMKRPTGRRRADNESTST